MQSFEPKFKNQFFCIPEGPQHLLKNTEKAQYLRSNKLAVRPFRRVFITYSSLYNEHNLRSKATEQLGTFPR
jgi:hypothetical protein